MANDGTTKWKSDQFVGGRRASVRTDSPGYPIPYAPSMVETSQINDKHLNKRRVTLLLAVTLSCLIATVIAMYVFPGIKDKINSSDNLEKGSYKEKAPSIPTNNPTSSPTTSAPTKSAQANNPTSFPTTSAPTKSPTSSSPTNNPTSFPTTSAPTISQSASLPPTNYDKPNFLLIFADDLGPVIDPYIAEGHPMYRKTPNINKIAKAGQSFLFATSQQSICGPSRHSFLSGRFPDTIKIFNNEALLSDSSSRIESIPKYFKDNHGYYTAAFGKIFHPQFDGNGKDIYYKEGHFSQPTEAYDASGNAECPRKTRYQNLMYCDVEEGSSGKILTDSVIASSVVNFLKQRRSAASGKAKAQNWLAMVGFRRPHLMNALPSSYFGNISLSSISEYNFFKPTPEIEGEGGFRRKLAYYECRRLENKYTGVLSKRVTENKKEIGEKIERVDRLLESSEEVIKIRRAYYAAITFLDTQVGRILDSLQENDFNKNTVVIFFSDHGYQMGERNIWCKSTLYNTAAAVPLIVSIPGLPQNRISESPTQLIDIFPTMIDLVGSNPDEFEDESGFPLDGVSLLPVILNESNFHHAAMYSQYPRCVCNSMNSSSQCPSSSDYRKKGRIRHPRFVQFHSCVGALSSANSFDGNECSRPAIIYMGYSIRTPHWKYIEWRDFHEERTKCANLFSEFDNSKMRMEIDREKTKTDWNSQPIQRELYDVSATKYQDQADDEINNLGFNPTDEALIVMEELSHMIKLKYDPEEESRIVCNNHGVLDNESKCKCIGNYNPKDDCKTLIKNNKSKYRYSIKQWLEYLSS